jgi:hypothetical protein
MNIRILLVLTASLFIFSSVFYYYEISEMFWNIDGFNNNNKFQYYFILYFLAAILPAFFLPKTAKKPSSIILWYVYYTNIVSNIIVFPFIVQVKNFHEYLYPLVITLIFIVVIFFSQKINLPIKKYKIKTANLTVILLLINFFSITYIYSIFGISFEPPSIDDVYGVREAYKDTLQSSGSIIVGYLVTLGGFVFAPVTLLIGFKELKHRKLLSIIFIISSLTLSFLIYSIGGFKSIAFAPIGALLLYYFSQKFNNHALLLAIGIPAFILFIYLLSLFFNIEFIFYHMYRRIFLTPGMNAAYFYDFLISNNSFGMRDAPNVISIHYYGTLGSANTGLFGDGYGKGRYFGVLFNAVLLFSMLIFIDGCSKKINPSIIFSLLIIIAYAIANSALTTTIITYGFLVVCFLFIIGNSLLGTNNSN